MNGNLVTAEAPVADASRGAVEKLLADGTFFWLDVEELDDDLIDLFRGPFGFHPLAVEDVEHFGQRPKIEDYDSYLLLVVYGVTGASVQPGSAAPAAVGTIERTGGDASGTSHPRASAEPVSDRSAAPRQPDLIEVHCFYGEKFLVTVHRGHCADLHAIAHRLSDRRGPALDPPLLLHRVIDSLVDGFFPILSALDDRIDELEDAILAQPTDDQLGTLFDMKRTLVGMRKVITPERDMFGMMLSGGYDVPGMDADSERYFRDVYDHLIRISDLVDSYRDLLTGAMDTHLSTVSNRLNQVMKQLTIIATIFLPLSFLTGFFGQNFGWLVARLTGWPVFAGAGLGLELLAVVGLLSMFRSRGWL